MCGMEGWGVGPANIKVTDSIMFVNCDAIACADPTSPTPYGGADGFAYQHNDGVRNNWFTNLYFTGCRAIYCSDDGFDFYWADSGMVFIENCWAVHNGWRYDDPTVRAGDGNGFKIGPNFLDKSTYLQFRITNCIASSNSKSGFTPNIDGDGELSSIHQYFNNFGHNNYARPWNYFDAANASADSVMNNLAYDNGNTAIYENGVNFILDSNSWQLTGPIVINADDFVSLDTLLLDDARQADGSPPDTDYGKLAEGSELIDRGLDIGRLPFIGAAPDVGYDESDFAVHWLWVIWWLIIYIHNREKFTITLK